MENTTAILKEKLAEILDMEEVKNASDDTNYVEKYELSSLQIVKYYVIIEELFSIEFDIDELSDDNFKSFIDLQNSINSHRERN